LLALALADGGVTALAQGRAAAALLMVETLRKLLRT